MMHRVEGVVHLVRPLADLATVFDMVGLPFCRDGDGARCAAPGLDLRFRRESAARLVLQGTVEAGTQPDLMRRIALALEADGIGFSIACYNERDEAQTKYESDH